MEKKAVSEKPLPPPTNMTTGKTYRLKFQKKETYRLLNACECAHCKQRSAEGTTFLAPSHYVLIPSKNKSAFTCDHCTQRHVASTTLFAPPHYQPPTTKQKSSGRRGLWSLLGFVQVDQSKVAIKEKFGKFKEVMEPGCHFLPWFSGNRVAGHISLRLQKLDILCETKTKDNVFVNVVVSIQYRALADKASDAFYKLSKTKAQIQAYVSEVIRASVAKINLHDVFEQKNDISKAVEYELEKEMSEYGYEIVRTLIVRILPDEHVKKAMNEINAVVWLMVAANEKAEAEKILRIKRAEGEAESKYLSGMGIAHQLQAIVDALKDSALEFSVNVPGTVTKDVTNMDLINQNFDTIKEINATSWAVRDVVSQIHDREQAS